MIEELFDILQEFERRLENEEYKQMAYDKTVLELIRLFNNQEEE